MRAEDAVTLETPNKQGKESQKESSHSMATAYAPDEHIVDGKPASEGIPAIAYAPELLKNFHAGTRYIRAPCTPEDVHKRKGVNIYVRVVPTKVEQTSRVNKKSSLKKP